MHTCIHTFYETTSCNKTIGCGIRHKHINISFLALTNKEQNFEIDSSDSSRGRWKYMKYVRFREPSLEAALSVSKFRFWLENNIWERISEKETSINAEL
jgi:hypothetical protein